MTRCLVPGYGRGRGRCRGLEQRYIRLRRVVCAAEVARRAGIRSETLSRLENGRGNPTVATVRKLVRAIARAGRRPARRKARAR